MCGLQVRPRPLPLLALAFAPALLAMPSRACAPLLRQPDSCPVFQRLLEFMFAVANQLFVGAKRITGAGAWGALHRRVIPRVV